MTNGADLLSPLRDYIGKEVANGQDTSGTQYIDWPWLERRIYEHEQESYEATKAGISDLVQRILFGAHSSTSETAAIIIMGEADLCSPMLERIPPCGKTRMPREIDLYELVHKWDGKRSIFGREHVGQYIISRLSLEKAKSRMPLASPSEPVRPVSPPLAPASKRLKTESVTEESEIITGI